ncbi:MAG: hypothetical protein ABIG95_03850 [Candidatus Woesearchaeota archaeon]
MKPYFLILLLLPTATAAGIGVSPSWLSFELLRGQHAKAELTLFNPTEQPTRFEISSDSNWFHFSPSAAVIPPFSRIPVSVLLKPTQESANKEYNPLIIITVLSDQPDAVKFNLGTAVKTKINITGKQRISLAFDSAEVADTEQGSQVILKLTLTNNGNVLLTPNVVVSINTQTNFTLREIYPGQKSEQALNISTNNMAIGSYEARIEVLLLGKTMQKTASFTLLPYGSMSRKGTLEKIAFVQKPALNQISKLEGTFLNTGKIPVMAKLEAELYLNNKLLTVLYSEEKLVAPNDRAELNININPTQPGHYLLKVQVLFSGAQSDEKQLTFEVAASITTGLTIMFSVVAIGFFAFELFKKSKFK